MNYKLIQSRVLLVLSYIMMFFSVQVFAKTISLHEQPQLDSKLVSTLDLAAGVIPIYTSADKEWIKIADPKNGNVGWVKASELNHANLFQTTFSIQEGKNDKEKSLNTYQIIQLGQPGMVIKKDSSALLQQIQKQQEAIHQYMQKSMENMNQLFKNEYFPMVLPVVVLPQQQPENHMNQTANEKPLPQYTNTSVTTHETKSKQ